MPANEPPVRFPEDYEPLTLDNTSRLLVNTLRFLIDEYGLAGVRRTLDQIEDTDAR
jgi:hypothetical protein